MPIPKSVTSNSNKSQESIADILPEIAINPTDNLFASDYDPYIHKELEKTSPSAFNINYEDVKKYLDRGIRFNPQDYASGKLDEQLAAAQSGWEKIGNAIAQTVVSEIGLGTGLAISDLFDAVGQAIGVSDHDFNNPVSRTLEGWQDKFNNEIAPIYTTPGVDIAHGGLGDVGWWANNIPSIMSSLTLLIPSTGAVKLAKLAGKGVKGLNSAAKADKLMRKAAKTEKFATNAEKAIKNEKLTGLKTAFTPSSGTKETLKLMGENFATAALSRTMENYQEARQTYNNMYADASEKFNNMTPEEYQEWLEQNKDSISENVDVNDRDAVAKDIAKKAADTTFKIDYVNTVFDVIQLYALKNIPFHGFRNAKLTTEARRLNKDAKRYAGKYKTVEELKEIQRNKTFKRKALDKINDLTVGSTLTIGAQLSEGLEEGINYIAQEEGMNLGHVMLGDANESYFSKRFNSYINQPELWESAFWGVAGGIAFQGLGSAFNKGRVALDRKEENKKAKERYEKLKAEGKEVAEPKYKELWFSDDTKRAEAELRNRLMADDIYQSQVKAINEGKDPFNPSENRTITPEEAELLKERARRDRITQMALTAMDAGTIKQLKSYIADENVRKAISEKLGISEEESVRQQAEDLRLIDEVQNKYDSNVKHLNNLSKQITAETGDYVPTEYIQLIARENINKELYKDKLNTELERWKASAKVNEDYLREHQDIAQQLDTLKLSWQDMIQVSYLTEQLGELEQEKKKLLNDKTRLSTIEGTEELHEINESIKSLRNLIYNVNPENGKSALLFGIQNSLNYKTVTDKDNTEKIIQDVEGSKEYVAIAKAIEEGNFNYLKTLDEKLSDIDEYALQAFQVFQDTYSRHLGKNSVESLTELSPELFADYSTIAAIQTEKALLEPTIITSKSQFEHELEYKHNVMNDLRQKAVADAIETLKSLSDKYGKDVIKSAVYQCFYGKQFNDIPGLEALSDADKTLLKNTLNYLNLSSSLNRNLFMAIERILDTHADVKAARVDTEENKEKENEKKSSSKSENSKSDNKKQSPTDISKKQQKPTKQAKTDTSEAVGQSKEPFNPQSGLVKYQRSDDGLVYIENGEIAEEINLLGTNNQGQIVTEDIRTTLGHKRLEDPEFYDQEEGVSLMDETPEGEPAWLFAKRPIVRIQNGQIVEVVEKGRLVVNNEENRAKIERDNYNQEQQENEELEAEEDASILSTGEEIETPIEDTYMSDTIPPDDDVEIPNDDILETGIEDLSKVEEVESIFDNKIYNKLITAIKTGNKIDYSALESELSMIPEYRELLKDPNLIDKADKVLRKAVKTAEELYNLSVDKVNKEGNAVVDAVVKASNIKENIAASTAEDIQNFKDSVDNLVKTYINYISEEAIDGKYYISLNSLLSFCNKVCGGNSHISEVLFNKLKTVLEQDIEHYVLTDSNVEEALNLSRIKAIERLKHIHPISKNEFPVNLMDVIEYLNKNNDKDSLKKLYDTIDSLNINDKIKVSKTDKAIEFEINGIHIGHFPYPEVLSDGGYKQVNEGWNYDVHFEGNGGIRSDLKTLFTRWLLNGISGSDPKAKELNDIILKWAYYRNYLNQEQFDNLVSDFANHPYIQDAKKNGYANSNTDDVTLLNHLGKIWGYMKEVEPDEDSKDFINDLRKLSVNHWFNKVFTSINLVLNLQASADSDVVVSDITEGKRIELESGEKINYNEIEDKLYPASKAIGSEHKGTIRLASCEKTGKLLVAGNNKDRTDNKPYISTETGEIDRPNATVGNTCVLIPVRSTSTNAKPELIQAYPRTIANINTDKRSSKKGKDFTSALKKYIKSELQDIAENPSLDKLERLLTSLFNNRIGGNTINSGLLYGFVKVAKNSNTGKTIGFNISKRDSNNSPYLSIMLVSDNNGFLQLRIKGDKSYNVPTDYNTITDSNEIVDTLVNTLTNNFTININHEFVKSDTTHTVPESEIVSIPKSTGKFTITLGDKVFEYDTYNDFILDNDLVLLRTRPNLENGKTNFDRFGGGNPEAAQQVKLKVVSVTSPVRRNEEKPIITKVKEILDTIDVEKDNKPSASETASKRLVKTIFTGVAKYDKSITDNILKNLLKGLNFNSQMIDLFPKNLIFVNKYIGDNAYTNVSKDKTYKDETLGIEVPAGTTVIGKEWLDLANGTIEDKKEAVRKLIHEQIHQVLIGTKDSEIDKLREVFDEFAAKNTNSSLNKYLYNLTEEDKKLYYTDGKINRRGLEEFLVETLTSKELALTLDSIDADKVESGKRKQSLLQKIFNFLAKAFGWKINNKQGLLQKEFNTLSTVFTIYDNQQKEVEEIVEPKTEEEKPVIKKKVVRKKVNTKQLELTLDEDLKEPEVQEEINETKEEPIVEQDNTIVSDTQSVDSSSIISDDDLINFSSIQEEKVDYTEEMQKIKDQAIADGTFMKAPNGNHTNLNERQWLQVRTKAFKEWFGDWENPTIFTANNVDNIKELMDKYPSELPNKFYHHSTNKFGRQPFDNREGNKEKLHIIGRLTTDKVDVLVVENPNSDNKISHITLATAEGVKPFESNKELENNQDKIQPLDDYVDTTFTNNLRSDVSKAVDENGEPKLFYHGTDKDFNTFEIDENNERGKHLVHDKHSIFFTDSYNKAFRYKKNRVITVFLNMRTPAYSSVKDGKYKTLSEYTARENELIKDNNYDSVIIERYDKESNMSNPTTQWVVKNPNQIKSATDNIGTYSTEDNDIRKSSIQEIKTSKDVIEDKSSSISDFINRFEGDEREQIVDRINKGEFNISCKK